MTHPNATDTPSLTSSPTLIHLVAHTHWDREWYASFETYRARLVDLLEAVFSILASEPEYVSFQLDGQTSMMEDYLALRPEKEEEVRRWVAAGRLLPGPWYTQPDEFLASGESLIRNLLTGIRMARAWGGSMLVGYLPDTFGHISQMPQILRGFGIKWAFVGRGVQLEGSSESTHRFRWQSPDGSEVLTLTVPYGNGLSQSTLPESARDEVAHMLSAMTDWLPGEEILMFHGADHVLPQAGFPSLIAQANEALAQAHLIHSTLPTFFSKIASADTPCTIRGELRDKRTTLLEGTLSTCMNVKGANAATSLLLERMVEPLSALAWLSGLPYPAALLGQAWKYVLQNHAHDSICACSVDAVIRDVLQRFRWAQDIGTAVFQKSLKHLAQGPDVPGSAKSQTQVVVLNTLGQERTGVVRIPIDFVPDTDMADVRIFDSSGEEVPHQVLSEGQAQVFVTRPHITPRIVNVKRIQVAFVAKDVPSVGSAPYRVVPVGKSGQAELAGMALARNRGVRRAIGSAPNRMENEHLIVALESDGTMTLTHKESGEIFPGQHTFEDSRDIGEVYNHVAPLEDRIVTSLGQPNQIALVANGPVYATFEIRTALPGVCSITSRVTLAAGARRVELVTEVENLASEHRLRALFPLGGHAGHSRADGQFDVKMRKIKRSGMDGAEADRLADCHPMDSFVDVEAKNRGLAILAKGLPEYEAFGEDETRVALTLIRSVRRGPYDIPVTEAQMLGTHRFEYAIFPHASGATESELPREALDYQVPLMAAQRGDEAPDATEKTSLFRIAPETLILSALKRSENGQALVARFYNSGASPVEGALAFGDKGPIRAEIVDLMEENGTKIEIGKEGQLAFPVRGTGIVTLKLFF
ncbi:MAG: glycoside hydrolase family 38 C-terminal domain-containing protein [Candidatus Latescibacterota bacterium]